MEKNLKAEEQNKTKTRMTKHHWHVQRSVRTARIWMNETESRERKGEARE